MVSYDKIGKHKISESLVVQEWGEVKRNALLFSSFHEAFLRIE